MKDDSWITTLRREIADLELKASWASQVGYGKVRDLIRSSIYELNKEIERRQELLDCADERNKSNALRV